MLTSDSRPRCLLLCLVLLLVASCGGSGGGKKKGKLQVVIGGDGYASGDVIEGLTPGQILEVSFGNVGAQPIRVAPVLFAGGDALDERDFVLEARSDYTGVSGSPPPGPALELPWVFLAADPVFGETFAQDPQRVAAWAQAARRGSAEQLITGFPVPGGPPIDLRLRPLPAPFDSSLEVRVDGEAWREGPTEILTSFSAWTGEVIGQPGSQVFLSFSSRGDRGWIRVDEDLILVGAQPDPVFGWEQSRTRVARASRLQQTDALRLAEFGCQTVPPPVREPGWAGSGPATSGDEGGQGGDQRLGNAATFGATRSCRLGFETDEDFFDLFGDAGAATTYVGQLVAAVGHRYQQRVQTRMSVIYLSLYDGVSDPWVAPGAGGSAEDLLNEFADHWGTNWPGAASNADLGHLLCSGMNQGGIAYFAPGGLLCSRTGGFGVSTGVTGASDWGNFNFADANGYWDFVVLAHEIGHNFGAEHTHDYCPPFDECSAAFGTCQTKRDCQKSSILSYCHTCPGGLNRIDPDFEPYIALVMRRSVDGSCLAELELDTGDTLRFSVTYEPKVGGASEVEMSWEHTASNLPSPFRLILRGN